ncbi:TPA: hypothetical protein L5U90_003457 [Pseudomonas aeruginosa]|nr:hypothetical protein [Pseudomonas aeruginosa]
MTDMATPHDDELQALRRDAARYRQVCQQTWYIDAAGRALGLIQPRRSALVDSPPRPDWDEVEAALDALIEGKADYESPYS